MTKIAVLYPGDMGHAVGRSLREHGHEMITSLAGRSDRTRAFAKAGGLVDAGELAGAVSEAELILSILPPSNAVDLAHRVAEALRNTGATPVYADCNAIAPETSREVEEIVSAAGASYIDGSIVGPPPGRGTPRFYVAGADTSAMLALDGQGIIVRHLGPRVGDASAMKMCYASITKGTSTLFTAALMVAHQHGLDEPFWTELQESQGGVWGRMDKQVARLPSDAGRWIGEMDEIIKTYGSVGVPTGFHEAAAQVYEVLTRTPNARIKREELDPEAGIAEVIAAFAGKLPSQR
ncbi:MAG: DUF1932 domain-containing protein [Alphaproteobacteria bacterium]